MTTLKPIFATLISLYLVAPVTVFAADKAGKVILTKGEVNAIDVGGSKRNLRRGNSVFEGDTIKTGADSMLQLNMVDNGMISLAENSLFSLHNYEGTRIGEEGKESVILDIVEGGFRAVTGGIGKSNPPSVKVRTGVASIGIRGTGYELFIYDAKMYIAVLSGTINISNGGGSLDIGDDAEFNFARIDGTSIAPVGLRSLPMTAAKNNPFLAATDVETLKRSFVVPVNELQLSEFEISHLTAINPDENPTRLTFTANDNSNDNTNGSGTDNGTGTDSGNSGSGRDSGTGTDSGIGTTNTSLTTAEVEQLSASDTIARVLLPDSNTPYLLQVGQNSSGETQFFIENGATLDSYKTLIRPDQASPRNGFPSSMVFDTNTTWGIWDASTDKPAAQYSMADGTLATTPLKNSIYWLTTTPAQNLEATFTFLTTGNYQGDSDLGPITSLSGGMRVNFDSASVTAGYLNITSGTLHWQTEFAGQINKDNNGGMLGQFTLSGEGQQGMLDGAFVKSDEIFYTGTFSLTNTDDNYARGLLAMQGYETVLVYGGNDPTLKQFGTLTAFEGSALLHGPSVTNPLTATQLGFNTDNNGVIAGWFIEKQNAGNFTDYPVQKTSLSNDTYWGVWNASESAPSNLRYRTRENKEYNTSITAPVYWMSTTAMAITREGTASFVSNGDFIGSSNHGAITSLQANVAFDFDSQLVTGGKLNIGISSANETWSFNFADVAQSNRMIDVQNGYFSVNQNQTAAQNSNGVFGRVEGYFVGDAQNKISTAFGLFRQGDSSYLDTVNGLFSMIEESN